VAGGGTRPELVSRRLAADRSIARPDGTYPPLLGERDLAFGLLSERAESAGRDGRRNANHASFGETGVLGETSSAPLARQAGRLAFGLLSERAAREPPSLQPRRIRTLTTPPTPRKTRPRRRACSRRPTRSLGFGICARPVTNTPCRATAHRPSGTPPPVRNWCIRLGIAKLSTRETRHAVGVRRR